MLTKAAATKADYLRMLDDEKMTVEQIAARLKIHRDSVLRALRRHKIIDPRRANVPVSLGERVRMRVLADEGVPNNWIAEDLGLDAGTVQKYLGPRPEAAAEWRSAWSGIRHNDDLYWLHHEIAPAARKTAHSGERRYL